MAFDSGMLCAVIGEIKKTACGCRVEKIYQPQNDEIDLQLRGRDGSFRLLMRCGSNDTRIQLTTLFRDNPQSPPTFCMLLRKHLQGAVFSDITQEGYERVAKLEFLTHDEMGYDCKKYLIAEVMGRNSNLIFTDEKMKIHTAMRQVDFTTSRLRQVLPGMIYEMPPAQEGKKDPRGASAEDIAAVLESAGQRTAAAALNGAFIGICPAAAREAVYRACGRTDALSCDCNPEKLSETLKTLLETAENGSGKPVMVYDGQKPVEFSYIPLTQYTGFELKEYPSFGSMLDSYYGERDRVSITGARATDLSKTVNSIISRLQRKTEIQKKELADCDREEEYRSDGELIVANLYRLKKGDESVRLTDYSVCNDDGSYAERTIRLDPRLTPSANAQKLFKKYAKCRKARTELNKQIAIAEEELTYMYTVRDALSRAETGADIAGIRAELEKFGYARQKKGAAPAKSVKNVPAEYTTSGGLTVLCGKNNLQNDELTFRVADRSDMWFHAKGVPGSHVILRCADTGATDEDMTEAAEIAARNSDAAGGSLIPVDYTEVRNIKKPSGARPGFVIYHTNKTAYVTPDSDKIAAMRKKSVK